MTESRGPRRARKSSAGEAPAAEAHLSEESAHQLEADFPIVGVGASAGGLAAFEAFFSGMPTGVDPDMAFVLVQHLAPDHKSILTDLVRRYTRMQVVEVEDGVEVQRNHTYIIPPNRDMALLNGKLHLLETSSPRGLRLPIDFFFRSLAQDQRERAIGVVLSGTGSDGTQGVRAIKGEGGMVMAQRPDTTVYDGMPRSAVATGLVDFELPPAEMPAQLISYVAHAFGRVPQAEVVPTARVDNALRKIFILIRDQTGHDFSEYKPSTIHRRVERRLAVNQIETIDEYVRYTLHAPAEIDALYHDLLIGVTSFFRDREAFEALESQVIPSLFTGRQTGGVVRIWSPACSTGEEAYSIAILLEERLEALRLGHKVQIFATDIDSQAIAVARTGLYPASIATDLTPERLARFFTPEGDGSLFRVRKGIRDMLVFSEQDVVRDPPFSKMDLISCRNLLIYMGSELQRKLLPLFHYALAPGAFLFLGTSESVGEFGDLFSVVDRKAKLYRRKDDIHATRSPVTGRFMPAMTASPIFARTAARTAVTGKLPLRELTEQALLQEVAPAGALVDARGDILYLHGHTGAYLEPAPGEAGVNNILKMAREGLRRDLTTALRRAVEAKETVRQGGLQVKNNGGFITVDLIVRPVAVTSPVPQPADSVATPEPPLYLVVFETTPSPETQSDRAADLRRAGETDGSNASAEASIAALERELRAKEEYLHTANEELETSNEELKSSNEEMQSLNEELQSTNEELETSKEELQSINEELATVNAELQTKVADLSRANNDLNNLLAGTGIGTVFVDNQLRILRFTPGATSAINLIASDLGRPVGHIASNLVGYDHMVADTKAVLDSLVPRETEVETTGGTWYAMRILPYRTMDNSIEGAVITFVDITEKKLAMLALRQAEAAQRLAVVVRHARDALAVYDLEGRVLAWNPGAEKTYGWTEAEALKMNVRDLIPEDDRPKALTKMRRLAESGAVRPYRARRITKAGVVVDVVLSATALVDESGSAYAIAMTERLAAPPRGDAT